MTDKTEKKLLEEIKKIDRPKRLVSRNAIKVYCNEAYDYMDILKAKLQQHRETKKEILDNIIREIFSYPYNGIPRAEKYRLEKYLRGSFE